MFAIHELPQLRVFKLNRLFLYCPSAIPEFQPINVGLFTSSSRPTCIRIRFFLGSFNYFIHDVLVMDGHGRSDVKTGIKIFVVPELSGQIQAIYNFLGLIFL